MKPFEGLFGITSELKIIEYLLPLNGVKFSASELAKENGISESVMDKIIKKFVYYGIVKCTGTDTCLEYEINNESPIVKSVEDINNYIIEKILGNEILYQINDYWQKKNE